MIPTTAKPYSKTYYPWELGTKIGYGISSSKEQCPKTTRSRSSIIYKYQLKGHNLEVEESSKYLVVDIQCNLHCNVHIDRVTKNANSMLVFFASKPKKDQQRLKDQCLHQYGQVKPELLCSCMESPLQGTDLEDWNGSTTYCPLYDKSLMKHQQCQRHVELPTMGDPPVKKDQTAVNSALQDCKQPCWHTGRRLPGTSYSRVNTHRDGSLYEVHTLFSRAGTINR